MQSWKNHYAPDRPFFAERERRCRKAWEAATGVTLTPSGIGAESEENFVGYSAEHGQEPGGADYVSSCGHALVEVTGSRKQLNDGSALWVGVAKMEAATAAFERGLTTYVMHENPRDDERYVPLLRVIYLDADLLGRYSRGELKATVYYPKGAPPQDMIEIPARDRCVLSLTSAAVQAKRGLLFNQLMASTIPVKLPVAVAPVSPAAFFKARSSRANVIANINKICRRTTQA